MFRTTGPAEVTVIPSLADFQRSDSTMIDPAGNPSPATHAASGGIHPHFEALRARSATFQARGKNLPIRRDNACLTYIAPGISRITIYGSAQGAIPKNMATEAGRIQSMLREGAVYTQVVVRNGARSVSVTGTSEGQPPVPAEELVTAGPTTSCAMSNAGYFVHKLGLTVDGRNANEGDIGRPVGPISTRADYVQVDPTWRSDYGQLRSHNGEVRISSGPVLATHGKPVALDFTDARFRYRLEGRENPKNVIAGLLTHASDCNERAAVSVREHGIGAEQRDLIFHSLTTNGDRTKGATMEEWQRITLAGAERLSGLGEWIAANPSVSTLNLDGGPSVYLGFRDQNGNAQVIERGGEQENPREMLPAIITAEPDDPQRQFPVPKMPISS